MVSSVKVDDVGLDHIMLVQGSKNNSEFLIANEKGNVKFLDIDTL